MAQCTTMSTVDNSPGTGDVNSDVCMPSHGPLLALKPVKAPIGRTNPKIRPGRYELIWLTLESLQLIHQKLTVCKHINNASEKCAHRGQSCSNLTLIKMHEIKFSHKRHAFATCQLRADEWRKAISISARRSLLHATAAHSTPSAKSNWPKCTADC